MGALPTKDSPSDRYDSYTESSAASASGYSSHPAQPSGDRDIPHEKRLAKRQIEVYYRDFFMLYHDREHAIARIDSAAHAGHIDEQTRLRLRKEQFMRELEYIRRKRHPMSMAHYDIIRKIGQGSFGEVFLVRHRGDRQLYAMKKLQKKDMIYKRQVNHVWLERFVLASVGEHPLVVKMHYSFQDQVHLYFVMEYLHGGDMMTMLIRKDYLPEDWARFYIAELVVAIDALHRTGIIHRDIKPDNILFRKNGHICLSDFGLSKSLMQPGERDWVALTGAEYVNRPNFIEHIRRGDVDLPLTDRVRLWKALAKEYAFSQVGTPNYIAPEVLQDNSYSESCDWWSVGVILFEMLVGCPPFCSRNPAHVTGMICQWRRYLHFPRELPESRLSNAAKDLICRLICESQNRLGGRRGLEEFKEHPFFRGIDWDNLANATAPFIPELESDTDTRYFEDEITKSDISLVIQQHPHSQTPRIRHEAPGSAASGSSGSGKDDNSSSNSGKLTRRRSSRRIRYNRNIDLEFVGFTFIPMRSETQWGSARKSSQDPYNQPPTTRPEQKPSAMTEALSLEGDRAESHVKPLRSPRGREAEAVIAAAEVTSQEQTGIHPPLLDKDADTVSKTTEISDSGNLRVRFVDTTRTSESRAVAHEEEDKTTNTEAPHTINGIHGQDRELRSLGPATHGMVQVDGHITHDEVMQDDVALDDLDERALGARRVDVVPIRSDDEIWSDAGSSGRVGSERKAGKKPNLHSCLSLPDLRSKGSKIDADDTDADDDTDMGTSNTNIEAESACSVATEEDGVERRMSRLNLPEEIIHKRKDRLSRMKETSDTSPRDGLSLPPTSSEVDLFVGYAAREMHSASRELTNTPSSNIPAVVRLAKLDLNGTAVELQQSLAPTGVSTSTASGDMSEFPERPTPLPIPRNSIVSDSM